MPHPFQKLDAMFKPESVAVVGASESPLKLGYYVMQSLMGFGFSGRIIPINPGAKEILGHKAYSSVKDVPGEADLVVIVVPAHSVLPVVEDCVQKQVKGIVIITSGFREIEDQSGEVLQSRIAETANQVGIPIIGPNTFGVLNCNWDLNATFSPTFVNLKGEIAVVAQSGGMTGITLSNFRGSRAGFSKVVGLGNRCNTDFADMLEFLLEDEETSVICAYMEGVDDPRRLTEVARNRKNEKPIVMYKAGRFGKSDQAASSHTGSMAGRHELYQAAFKQAGIVTVNTSEELADAARILRRTVLPQGNRVAVLVAQAGLGIVACDVCEQRGLILPTLEGETKKTVEELLPPMSMRTNPIDLALGWYFVDLPARIINALMEDADIDALLISVIFGGANMPMFDQVAEIMLQYKDKKPMVTCFTGPGEDFEDRIAMLEENGIVNYPNPERAAAALSNLVRHASWVRRRD